uniref:Serine/threonine-protein phosphatase n=1 Tax=Albugo laibachii Nc14 TaxID=890382 RepID=F0WEC9_9STRA|nr:calcineurinlike phosphoesterase putative [Albugo laibachii Nc14]|eukprot:CCA19560.1 calcineurinlike phosphoesterase putative [Albugo laibachii Nc14]
MGALQPNSSAKAAGKAVQDDVSAYALSPRSSDASAVSPKSTRASSASELTDKTAPDDEKSLDWKLFMDLETREEKEALELSGFLNALEEHFPMQNETEKNPSLERGNREPVSNIQSIDISDVYLSSSSLDKVLTLRNAQDMIESCQQGKKIKRSIVIRVCKEICGILREEANVVDLSFETASEDDIKPNQITLLGDLHGQLDDLLFIFRKNGLPSPSNPYIINGDFVDRGDRGVEVCILLYLFKLLYPKAVHINRGNHEDSNVTQVFGFMSEVLQKYDREVYYHFCETFKWLRLATLIEKSVLVVHGGIERNGVLLQELQSIRRYEYNITDDVGTPGRYKSNRIHQLVTMRDLLWSDPQNRRGVRLNSRGIGICYGFDVVNKFMAKNKLKMIVRSHECVPAGFEWPFGDKTKLVTIFSASNYGKRSNNFGCYMHIMKDLDHKPKFFQYKARTTSRDMGVANLDALFGLIVHDKVELLYHFDQMDKAKTGLISISQWCEVMERVLAPALDWRLLQPLLTNLDSQSKMVPYREFLERYNASGKVVDDSCQSTPGHWESIPDKRELFNKLYRHRSRIQALFRTLDRDGNGTISLKELQYGIRVLNEKLPLGTKSFTENAEEWMRLLDFSHDNEININEFMECFRLSARLTLQAKWRRTRSKLRALSAIGAFPRAISASEEASSTMAVISPPNNLYNETAGQECEETILFDF